MFLPSLLSSPFHLFIQSQIPSLKITIHHQDNYLIGGYCGRLGNCSSDITMCALRNRSLLHYDNWTDFRGEEETNSDCRIYVTKPKANYFYLRIVPCRVLTYYLANFLESGSSEALPCPPPRVKGQ
jgi:hypothetical protein